MSESTTYPVSDWQDEVSNGNTRLGYEAWVLGQRSLAQEEVRRSLGEVNEAPVARPVRDDDYGSSAGRLD